MEKNLVKKNTDEYEQDELIRVRKLYGSRHKKGFVSKDDLANWFIKKLDDQEFCCFYCDTSIFDLKKLIKDKKLKTRKTGYGERGPVLEIDKKENGLGYARENCVLACYYCNNDKSYVSDWEEYKTCFGGNRHEYFKSLISKNLVLEVKK
jgi:5-methylcytosine-specific restriction endonuclease McrA